MSRALAARPRGSLWQRFWSKVSPDPVTGCWLWVGATGKRRRGGIDGRLRRGGASEGFVSPHRQALIFAAGPPPWENAEACHTCGESLCCNPVHLYWGSRSQNERDKQYVDAVEIEA